MTDERAMKLARKCAVDAYGNTTWECGVSKDILAGRVDDGPVMKATLAAIKLTTQLAADLAWKQADDLNHGPRAEYKDHRQFDAGRAHEANIMCNRLRNNEHLPADGGENV